MNANKPQKMNIVLGGTPFEDCSLPTLVVTIDGAEHRVYYIDLAFEKLLPKAKTLTLFTHKNWKCCEDCAKRDKWSTGRLRAHEHRWCPHWRFWPQPVVEADVDGLPVLARVDGREPYRPVESVQWPLHWLNQAHSRSR